MANLTIDDVLNLRNLPVQPTSKYAAWSNRHNMDSNLQHYQQDLGVSASLSQKRASFYQKKFTSVYESGSSSSLDDPSFGSFQQDNAYTEHKLKVLESNFDQISMAHHSDEHAIQMCIDAYKEKFKKTDAYMQILFEDINSQLIKLVECHAELYDEIDQAQGLVKCEQVAARNNGTISQTVASQDESSCFANEMELSGSGTSVNCTHEACGSMSGKFDFKMVKANKILVQDTLSRLNKTFASLRKNMINLVTTSSIISSLKQVKLGFSN